VDGRFFGHDLPPSRRKFSLDFWQQFLFYFGDIEFRNVASNGQKKLRRIRVSAAESVAILATIGSGMSPI
jgi:hypothetical protein